MHHLLFTCATESKTHQKLDLFTFYITLNEQLKGKFSFIYLSSQIPFIYIALYTILIFSKLIYSDNGKIIQIKTFWLYSSSERT